jgi:hypothetical protein
MFLGIAGRYSWERLGADLTQIFYPIKKGHDIGYALATDSCEGGSGGRRPADTHYFSTPIISAEVPPEGQLDDPTVSSGRRLQARPEFGLACSCISYEQFERTAECACRSRGG